MRSLTRRCGIAAAAAAILFILPTAASADPSEIYMSDACSPSFNVALNDPTICNRPGGTPFDVFIQQLTQNKFAGAWRFSAPQVRLREGDSLTVENRGGETHTVTQATQFGGGGIVDAINLVLFGTLTPPTFFFGPPTSWRPATRRRFPPAPSRRALTCSSASFIPGWKRPSSSADRSDAAAR